MSGQILDRTKQAGLTKPLSFEHIVRPRTAQVEERLIEMAGVRSYEFERESLGLAARQ